MLRFLDEFGCLIRWIAGGVMALSGLLMLGVLPWRDGFDVVSGWIEGQGPWTPIAFVGVYLVTTLALLPGWWLSVLAGTIFGLWWGLVVTSASSTLGAAAGFIVARRLARGRLERAGRNSRMFQALDSAVREGGWRIVALVRLSPVFPFGLQNYLYGLTPIGFWTYLVTSWAAMLPGNFLYVYLGALTRMGAEAGAAPASPGAGAWALHIAGFAATITCVLYITRLARRSLRRQTHLAGVLADAEAEADADADAEAEQRERIVRRTASRWITVVMAAAAVLMVGGAGYAQLSPREVTVAQWVGASSIAAAPFGARGSGSVDHRPFTALLKRIVTDDGLVDYGRLREDEEDLNGYLKTLAGVDLDGLDRDEKLAVLINAYNAFTLALILDHWPVDSIKDIPEAQRWDAKRWKIGDRTLSLTQIEHEWLRGKFNEPRIHFAINCASVGCPPLLDEAYVPDRLDEQLEQVTRVVHTSPSRWFEFDAEAGVVRLTKLYDWYGEDFEKVAASPVDFAARYAPALRAAIEAGHRPRVEWLEYDWSLNRAGARTSP